MPDTCVEEVVGGITMVATEVEKTVVVVPKDNAPPPTGGDTECATLVSEDGASMNEVVKVETAAGALL